MSRLRPAARPGIVVMGPYRSGTSLVCRMLSSLGVDFGPAKRLLRPDAFNPGGYLQRADVRLANSRLLRSAGSGFAWPADPEHIAARGDLSLLRVPDLDWRAGVTRWGIKDPRFCATLQAWLAAGVFERSRIRVVHVMRSSTVCANSLIAMPELARQLRPATLAVAEATIRRYADLAAWHAAHLDVPVFSLSYEALMDAPSGWAARFAEFVGNTDTADIAAAARQV